MRPNMPITGCMEIFKQLIFLEENKNIKIKHTTYIIKFLIYVVVGFAVAFIYRQIKNNLPGRKVCHFYCRQKILPMLNKAKSRLTAELNNNYET